jgi:hypothetical protein
MQYLNENELKTALNEVKQIEERANEFITELYQNGNYTDLDVLSFIEKPNSVYKTVREVGYNEALKFTLATQRELLEQQADETAGRLKQLAANIFFGLTLSYKDIEKACFIDKGIFKTDSKKLRLLLTDKFTYELTPIQNEFYKKVENFCKVLNSLNTYAENSNSINYLDVNTSHYKFIKGGLNNFRERTPYSVNVENILKYFR